MNLTIKDFIDRKLSPNSYIYLFALVHDDPDFIIYLEEKLGDSLEATLKELEANNYIKIVVDSIIALRKKTLDLKAILKPEVEFGEFWDKYHNITGLKKTDLQPCLKYWKKLTSKEKQSAIDNIQSYYDSLPIYSTGKPVKKARTYLDHKNFNDEFEKKEGNLSNRMI